MDLNLPGVPCGPPPPVAVTAAEVQDLMLHLYGEELDVFTPILADLVVKTEGYQMLHAMMSHNALIL